jgi:hypothetical protein
MPYQRPETDPFTMAPFGCPLCNYGIYARVAVKRPDGSWYHTQFFECCNCSVMFRNPGRFARLGKPVRRWMGDIDPVSLREVHGLAAETKPPEDKEDS